MVRNRLMQSVSAAILAAVIPFGGPAFAQTPASTGTVADDASGEGFEIIVTAQKRSERLSDVPMSIASLASEDLVKRGVESVDDLPRLVPGFTYQINNIGLPVYGIRGISFLDQSSLANPAVSVYVDQIPLAFSTLTRGAALDLERVEVLKGPQGTLFGQNSTGGAVNYIAAKPTEQFSAGGSVTYGRFNQLGVDGFVSAPLSSTLGIRVAAKADMRGNWQKSTKRNEENGKRDFLVGRVLLDWKPSADVNFTLNVNGWRDKSDTQSSQFIRFAPFTTFFPYQPPVDALSVYGPVPKNARETDFDPGVNLARDDDFWQVALSGTVNVTPDITLTSLTSYLEFKQNSPYDGDATDYRDIFARVVSNIKTFNQELRLSGKTGPLQWMIGGSLDHQSLYEDQRIDFGGTNAFLFGVVLTQLSDLNTQKVDTSAVFGSLDLDVGSGVTLQGSARYTSQDRDYNGCTRDGGDGSSTAFSSTLTFILTGAPPIAPAACTSLDINTFQPVNGIPQSLDENNFSWRLGANWKITPDAMVYGNVTKGFKSGSFSNLPITFSNQATRVDQESVLAYEAGFKAALLDKTIQISGAGFYYDFRNKQAIGTVSTFLGPFNALINLPKASVKGAELNIDWRPVRNLKLNAAGTYLKTQVENSLLTQDTLGNPIDVKGEALPNTPKWQLTGDAEYSFPLGSSLDAYVGGSVSYRSSAFANFGEQPDLLIDKYALVGLRAGLTDADNRWRVQIWGQNITNKYYSTNIGRQVDTLTRFAGMPATYGVTLGFTY
ncbi:TonB-dependent receptor [Sphingobium fluviale]|uniref:TonB-dependent receptor n=1 Tax=Sphingobium fluviale TaxID=2506423 RepID=A0A4Q1KIP1_9SPHN|nr:TonB-dependent receptor [Sphingobium fluviale]RXR29517.1 TonB-dependent receptor [Sphingobium fluviale]